MKIVEIDQGIIETTICDNGKVIINRSKDDAPFLKANQEFRNNAVKGWREDLHLVASIPELVIEMWNNELKEKGHRNYNCLARENEKWFIAKLNSSDFAKLRTKEGKI